MAPMPRRLPDDVFREAAPAESDDIRPSAPTAARAGTRTRLRARERGVARGMFVGTVAGALLIGFGVGRLIGLDGDQPTLEPSPSVSTSTPGLPTASPSALPTLVPYDGPTRPLTVLDATGTCLSGASGDEPAYLIDANPMTIWRCPGSGTEEQVQFVLAADQPVVGVRVVNGNTSDVDDYAAERRILRIRWAFDDGSFVVQGLSGNDLQPQELRFPPTETRTVTMTVLESTVPGSGESENDAVSISALDFLTPAQ